ncbi:ABC transporter ATP-binding protein [Actinomadura sp. 6N118]|uniref:ABC transporter ATP-binding protein n=1 Tax=Actinomadura sp. 6N118 TaxID=3375151 RepID=UPI0037911945
MTLLQVTDLRLSFGGVRAIDGLSFEVGAGEIVSVIGPNGAGKTSAFNCVTGFYKPTGGSVLLDGTPVTGRRPASIAALGVSRTFQNPRLFAELSVLDNVRAGTHLWLRQSVLDALLHTPRYRRSEQEATDEAHRWLDFVGLRGERAGLVRNLPYGEQRRVEIARALARRPKLLLLDEPAAGLNHTEKAELLDLIRRIRDLGTAIALIEHDMGLVMEVSERVVVLNFGREIAVGGPAEVRRDPAVVEAYLGRDADEEELAAAREEVRGGTD